MPTSRVPTAIDALLAILRAAPALAEIEVLDGPPVGDQSDSEYVAVGWQPTTDVSAELQQDFASAGARRRDETFTILCHIDTWTGDSSMSDRRTRAFALLAIVEDALRATDAAPDAPTLGGAVLWAHVTAGTLLQVDTPQGVQVRLPFTISCHARL